MAKECALSTGYLPRGGLPRNSVDRITDCPDMTSAVDRGRKASTQTKTLSPAYTDVATALRQSWPGCKVHRKILLKLAASHQVSPAPIRRQLVAMRSQRLCEQGLTRGSQWGTSEISYQ